MKSHTVKVVDKFNGWEGPAFSNRTAAQHWIDNDRERFYSNIGLANARYCKTIVPIEATWGWNQRHNTFTWE